MDKREEIFYALIDTLAEKLKLGGGGTERSLLLFCLTPSFASPPLSSLSPRPLRAISPADPGAGDAREVTLIGQGISSAILLLISRLREPGDLRGVRPVARLHSILGLLLRAISATGSSSFMRMNLYASLSNYLQCVFRTALFDSIGDFSLIFSFSFSAL